GRAHGPDSSHYDRITLFEDRSWSGSSLTSNAVNMVRERQRQIRVLDLFSGVGGSSLGAQMAGAHIAAAIDAWDLACHTYSDNFRDAQVYASKCEDVDPNKIKDEIGDINLLIASPECTSHTCARGSRQRSEDSRNTA